MKKRVLLASLMVLLSVALFSCGGGGGVPGSHSGDTNINITSVSVTSTTNHDVDVAGDTISRDSALIAIGAAKQNPGTTPFPATVTECKITYSKRDTDAPTIADLTIFPGCTLNEGDNACSVTLIDVDRKAQFVTDMIAAGKDLLHPVHYLAKYSCDFKNHSGEPGDFPASYDIWLADFGPVPPLAVTPASATIPVDGSASALFLITGGILPYHAVPDNPALVDVTDVGLTDNFTVTAKNAGTGDVTITVTDSSSTPQSVDVTVTVQ